MMRLYRNQRPQSNRPNGQFPYAMGRSPESKFGSTPTSQAPSRRRRLDLKTDRPGSDTGTAARAERSDAGRERSIQGGCMGDFRWARSRPAQGTVAGLAVSALLVFSVAALAGPVGTLSGFEDDDGNLVDNAAAGIDWNSFKPTTWTGTAPARVSNKTASGWTFLGLEDAQKTSTDTAFAGGTKQDDNCASVIGASAPNKDDLKRAYMTTATVGGHVFLNLAWVRIPQQTTSSSAHIGFEFNKAISGNCPEPAGS